MLVKASLSAGCGRSATPMAALISTPRGVHVVRDIDPIGHPRHDRPCPVGRELTIAGRVGIVGERVGDHAGDVV